MLIGISGHMRAGKDTIADYLCARHHFRKLGFADALKREVQRILPRTLQEYVRTQYGVEDRAQIADKIHDLLYVTRDPVTRALLQEWGTDLRRTEDPQYWIKQWQMAYLDCPASNIVAADVRFPNEARCIVACGGDLVLVRRPGQDGNGHQSEDFCDKFSQWSHVFDNTGTVDDLYGQVESWLCQRRLALGPKASATLACTIDGALAGDIKKFEAESKRRIVTANSSRELQLVKRRQATSAER